jgi:hypothetical protein
MPGFQVGKPHVTTRNKLRGRMIGDASAKVGDLIRIAHQRSANELSKSDSKWEELKPRM